MLASPAKSDAIVIGFLGGFVRRDDSHHPEVQLIQSLRQKYPSGAYFGLFENGNIDQAYQAILSHMDASVRKVLPEKDRHQPQIILFGHSWGASAVVRLSRKLDRQGIPVALTVQVDSVAKPFSNDHLIPPNVLEAVNFYQTRGLVHGRSMITAADPARTRIIGNFRRDYKSEPAPCHQFPWYSRFFTKGHIAIECDPELWREVTLLLSRHLSNETLSRNQSQTPETRTPTAIRRADDSASVEPMQIDERRRENSNGDDRNQVSH